MSVLTDHWNRERENCLMDPDYCLTSECAAGPGFTLRLELPLFLWFRYCTMVEMQRFGSAYEKNILASFRALAGSPGAQQGQEIVSWLCPAELRLWALLGTAGGREQEYAGAHIPGVSTDRGQLGGSEPAWIRPGQGRALLPRSNPFSWDWHQRAPAHTALPARPFLSSLPPFTPIFFPLLSPMSTRSRP